MIANGTSADPSKPSGPRVYDYLLGGTDNFPADRELAGKMLAEYPEMRDLCRENRRFVIKAARWVASKGAAQFIDIGAGLPSFPSVHQEVQDARPSARVAYADRDPMVLSHLRAAQAAEGWEGTAVIAGDAEDPGSVLADPALPEVISLAEPACLILGWTLGCMDAGTARAAAAGFTAGLAAGSAVIISCLSFADRDRGDAFASALAPACGWRSHGPEDVASFFGDLPLVGGMVTDVRRWLLLSDAEDREARVLGGVALVG